MLAPLPQTLAPPAPFPAIVAQSSSNEFVAPGIARATYRLQTADGPLVVHVVAIDPREPTVRLGTVVASDRMISRGETVSSMALRTGAVAGINADYFDIGNTYQPLNVVVRDGALQRTPSKRVALDVRTDRTIHFETVAFTGTVKYGTTTLPLTGVNEWPPQGGATLLTQAYGALRAAPGVSLAELVALESTRTASTLSGTYRVAAVAASRPHAIESMEIGFGPAARARGPLPAVGDTVVLDLATTPPLDDIACAVGGGPLLVSAGSPVDDPNAPAPEERDRRFPVSGALLTASGDLLLVEVDGRAPALSIGVTRPQFAALALGFAATHAMAFDSGGSAELVARTLGERDPSVYGMPSDGEERHVADGLFIYSDAPIGAPSQLAIRPASVLALPNARVALRATTVDAAGHALGDVRLDGGDTLVTGSVSSVARVRSGALFADVPIEVVSSLARLDLVSDVRNPEPRSPVRLTATGYDATGRRVELGDALEFSIDRGTVARDGSFTTTARDATIVARAGGVRAMLHVPVGHHTASLAFFDAARAAAWAFASAPPGAARALAFAAPEGPPELGVPFDFTRDERAAYAVGTGLVLPAEALAFSVDIASDVRGIGVRATFVNRFGETRAFTLAKNVDWTGFATRTIALPDDLNPPVRLASLYAVNSLGDGPVRSAGLLRLRKPAVVIAGTR